MFYLLAYIRKLFSLDELREKTIICRKELLVFRISTLVKNILYTECPKITGQFTNIVEKIFPFFDSREKFDF
jgi:hypothetical protein